MADKKIKSYCRLCQHDTTHEVVSKKHKVVTMKITLKKLHFKLFNVAVVRLYRSGKSILI